MFSVYLHLTKVAILLTFLYPFEDSAVEIIHTDHHNDLSWHILDIENIQRSKFEVYSLNHSQSVKWYRERITNDIIENDYCQGRNSSGGSPHDEEQALGRLREICRAGTAPQRGLSTARVPFPPGITEMSSHSEEYETTPVDELRFLAHVGNSATKMESFLHTLVGSERPMRKREVAFSAVGEVEVEDHSSAPAPLVESEELECVAEEDEAEMKNKKKDLDLGDLSNKEDAVKSKGKKGKKKNCKDEEDKKPLWIKIIIICLLIPLTILLIQCCLHYRHKKRGPRCICGSHVKCRPTCPGSRKIVKTGKGKEREERGERGERWEREERGEREEGEEREERGERSEMDSHIEIRELQDIELQGRRTCGGGRIWGKETKQSGRTCKYISMQSSVSSDFNPKTERPGGDPRTLMIKDAATASATNSKISSAIETKNAGIQKSRRHSKRNKAPVTIARVSECVSKTLSASAHEDSAQHIGAMNSSIRRYKKMLYRGLKNMESVTGDSRESATGTTSVSGNPSALPLDGLKERRSSGKLESVARRGRLPGLLTRRATGAIGRRCRGRRAENLPLLSVESEEGLPTLD